MLAVSSLICTTTNEEDERKLQMESFGTEEFPDLLESINFDDLFMGINDEDVLSDLEMDNSTEILAEFSAGGSGVEEISDMKTSVCNNKTDDSRKHEEDKISGSWSGLDSCLSSKGEEIVSKGDESESVMINPVSNKEKGNKYSSSSKTKTSNSNPGKKKVKVDWTPELHRRFVQAVEKLGVDKAVPSRILEIMGIDCLTRHNIASHLQKYRSHRKHLLAREAEAATWSHRRQTHGGGGGGGKRDVTRWHLPSPLTVPMHYGHHFLPQFRPLHVWGHPPVEQPMYMWPKHLPHSPSPSHTWPPPPPIDPSYWHFQQHQQRVRNGVIAGTSSCPWPVAPMRFGTVPGIPSRQSCPSPPFDLYPSEESVDAVIGDVLSKPWQPLPLGLKPPSVDGVIGELQRQGVANIPATCA